ncbi:hypothetical protein PVAP13_7KG003000 [Panicum virgatum]|uniref:Uncharacterized protein n=1 Tax=Panicum virgatum TaxID=38727 RepID=A0A8T0QD71_PANVG|nr:hypothetical protein PVAP13_7KG003000 [Panicum virgatum]
MCFHLVARPMLLVSKPGCHVPTKRDVQQRLKL